MNPAGPKPGPSDGFPVSPSPPDGVSRRPTTRAASANKERKMRDYEFHIYDADEDGRTSVDARIEVMTCSDDRAAKTLP